MRSPAGDPSDDVDPLFVLGAAIAIVIAIAVSVVVVAANGPQAADGATPTTSPPTTAPVAAPPTTVQRLPAPVGVSLRWGDDGRALIRGTVQSEEQFGAIIAAGRDAFGEGNVDPSLLGIEDAGGVDADERIGILVTIIDRMPSRLTEGVVLLQDNRLSLSGTLAPGFGTDVFDDLLAAAAGAGLAASAELTPVTELDAYERTIEIDDDRVLVRGTVASLEDAMALTTALGGLGLGEVTDELRIADVSADEGTVTLIGEIGEEQVGALRTLVAGAMVRDQLDVISTEARAIDQLNELFALEPILFDTGRATIRDESADTLDRAAEILTDVDGAALRIEGHTDSQGDADANLALSRARADAVLDALVERGVDPTLIEAQGFGESRPIADNTTAEGRQANRRIEFVLLGA